MNPETVKLGKYLIDKINTQDYQTSNIELTNDKLKVNLENDLIIELLYASQFLSGSCNGTTLKLYGIDKIIEFSDKTL
ncbi:hypothetical protein CPAV1605_60 [seawater metagenome]|uniref:Uncharacterized protein n=1 Tax=seawater metagenome TaxID=1561972 RepID=A0A5E8CFT5_9ZZZZ